ncbi:MAG TPA: HlyC/CorC family transporter [Clostridiales bacterium]|jgi:putative hemolysin|nr:HlyC/CorC family transporter [Clostridiales bacterium]
MWPYIAIIIMIVLSAFFSGSEIAFNTSNKLRLKKSAEAGEKTAAMAYKTSENFTTTALSTILIGNNLVNLGASAITTVITVNLLLALGLGEKSDTLASLIATTIMTVIILIFGEIIPKILGKQHADTVVRWVAYPIRILTIILYPVIFLIMLPVNLLRRLWGRDNDGELPTVTEEELSSIIDTVEEEGVIDEDKGELLQSTLTFKDTTVEEIMTPRIDLVSIDINDSPEVIEETIENSRFSRIPVYEDSIDDIIGVLYLNHYYKNEVHENKAALRDILIPPCFIHKTMRLPAALNVLREKQTHLAIVIDEFGGTLGIVTMEDILEELVGDIWDESDEVVDMITKTGESTYEVNGDMNIDDLFEYFDISSKGFECDYSTVGGWAIEALDANPHIGDTFSYKSLIAVVSGMDDMRVTKVTVLVKPPEQEDEDED